MVSAKLLFASLLVASAHAGSHLSTTFPDRLQAIKRSTVMRHYDLMERQEASSSSSSADPALDKCIQQCKADAAAPKDSSAPPPPAKEGEAPPPPPEAAANATEGAAGEQKKIVVAPQKGVLKFVPFSTTVAEGETVMFEWGAGPHTVTQSSGVDICNKTLAVPDAFVSGKQEAGFQFPVTIKDAATPTWFYCSVPNHCQKGMFGLINPPKAEAPENQLSTYINQLSSKDKTFAALMEDTKNVTAGNSAAWNWGNEFDASAFPGWSMPVVAENVMETRKFFAQNPRQLVAHGVVAPGEEEGSGSSSVSSSSASDAQGSSSPQSGASSGSAAPAGGSPGNSESSSSSSNSQGTTTTNGNTKGAASAQDTTGQDEAGAAAPLLKRGVGMMAVAGAVAMAML